MTVTIRQAATDEIDALIPLLLLAEPSLRALHWSLRNMTDAAYRLDDDGELIAAATMRWRGDPCELVELGVAESHHGRGYGRQFIDWLVAEAQRRGKREMIVGTSSTSAANILFYQKCGFRIDSIRHDYFWYYDEPQYENGLPIRDMIVFRRDL